MLPLDKLQVYVTGKKDHYRFFHRHKHQEAEVMKRRQFLMRTAGFLALAGAISGTLGQSIQERIEMPRTSIHRIEADGVTVFYREAGPRDAPVVLYCTASRRLHFSTAS
jgi:hypothetical protein